MHACTTFAPRNNCSLKPQRKALSFQGYAYQLFADLAPLTISKIRAMKPQIQILMQHQIPYQWGSLLPLVSPPRGHFTPVAFERNSIPPCKILNYPVTCYLGCGAIGTDLHIWWNCPVARQYWLDIFNILSTLFAIIIAPYPLIGHLRKHPLNMILTQFKLLLQVTTASKHAMAKAWKPPNLSTVEKKLGSPRTVCAGS